MTWMIGGVPPFEEPPTYIEFDWYAISNLGFAQEMLKKPPKKQRNCSYRFPIQWISEKKIQTLHCQHISGRLGPRLFDFLADVRI